MICLWRNVTYCNIYYAASKIKNIQNDRLMNDCPFSFQQKVIFIISSVDRLIWNKNRTFLKLDFDIYF